MPANILKAMRNSRNDKDSWHLQFMSLKSQLLTSGGCSQCGLRKASDLLAGWQAWKVRSLRLAPPGGPGDLGSPDKGLRVWSGASKETQDEEKRSARGEAESGADPTSGLQLRPFPCAHRCCQSLLYVGSSKLLLGSERYVIQANSGAFSSSEFCVLFM